MADYRDPGPVGLAERPTAPSTKSIPETEAVKAIRQEVARAFGIAPEPSYEQLKKAFVDGARAVLELRKEQKIERQQADLLLKALTTLFVSAVTEEVLHGALRGGRSHDLSIYRYFRQSLR